MHVLNFKVVVVLSLIFFPLFTCYIFNLLLQPTYASISAIDTNASDNIKPTTFLNITEIKNNNSIPNTKSHGSVSILTIPQTNMTSRINNSGGIEPLEKNTINDNIQKSNRETFALQSNNTQFSLSNLLTNNISQNSSSPYHADYDKKPLSGTTSHQLGGDSTLNLPLNTPQFLIPPKSINERSSFQGINFFDAGNLLYPPNVQSNKLGPANVPDPQIAIGPSHVGEVVNVAGAYFTKKGDLIRDNNINHLGSPFTLDFFFKSGKNFLTDPRLIYDNSTGRWLAFILDATNKTVRIAISNPGDPLKSNWQIYEQPFGGCPDQPTVGISKDKVIISANTVKDCVFDKTFLGSQFVVIDKQDLLKGDGNISKVFISGQYGAFFSLVAAKLTDPAETSNLYLVKIGGGYTGGTGGNSSSIFTISGKVPDTHDKIMQNTNFTISETTRTINNVIEPIEQAKQLGFSTDSRTPGISLGDARVLDVDWHDGKMWFAANDQCKPKGDNLDHGCFRLVQVDTRNNYNITQDFDVSFPGKDLFMPSVAIDSRGNLGVIFSYSSINDNPGILAAIKYANSTNNALDRLITIMPGMDIANSNRYGDYSGIVVDPSHPNQFWAVAEFVPVSSINGRGVSPFWSTIIANFPTSIK